MALKTQWAGLGYGLAAVAAYTAFMILTREVVVSGRLEAVDLVAVRFLFAGLFFLALRRVPGATLSNSCIDWRKALALALMLGPPYVLLVSSGLTLSPARDAATFINGSMVLSSAAFAFLILRERFSAIKLLGLGILASGLALSGGVFAANWNLSPGLGLFILGGVLWAAYGVLLKKWNLSGFQAAEVTSILPLVTFVPIVLVLRWDRWIAYDLSTIVWNGLFQGVLVAGLALIAFSKSVEILGPSRSSLLMPLVPIFTLVAGALILKESPELHETGGTLLVVLGILFGLARPSSPAQNAAISLKRA